MTRPIFSRPMPSFIARVSSLIISPARLATTDAPSTCRGHMAVTWWSRGGRVVVTRLATTGAAAHRVRALGAVHGHETARLVVAFEDGAVIVLQGRRVRVDRRARLRRIDSVDAHAGVLRLRVRAARHLQRLHGGSSPPDRYLQHSHSSSSSGGHAAATRRSSGGYGVAPAETTASTRRRRGHSAPPSLPSHRTGA